MSIFTSKKPKTKIVYYVDWSKVNSFEDMKKILGTYTWSLRESEPANALFADGFLIKKEVEY
jgi:hypothetical protein